MRPRPTPERAALITLALLGLALTACSDDEPAGAGDSGADVSDDRARDGEDDGASDLAADVAGDGDAAEDGAPDLDLEDTPGEDADLDAASDDGGTGDSADDAPGDGSDDGGGGDVGLDTPLDDLGGDQGAVVCGGFAGDTCGEDEYCDFPDDLCGAADGPGLCTPRPELCTADYRPVCGCDGETHSNDCRAAQQGADQNALGGCDPPEGWTPCGPGFCILALSYCQRLSGGAPPGFTSYSCQDLPDCEDPTSCECVADEPCSDACDERDDGSLMISCFAP